MHHQLLTLVTLLALIPATVFAGSLPVRIDGDFDEWAGIPVSVIDASGDHGPSGIDFTQLVVANDPDWLYLFFDTTAEVQGDEGQGIELGIDTDMNAGTGQSMSGIGADLVWEFGQREGTFTAAGNGYTIRHDDIGFVIGPTVSDTRFEMSLDRSATPAAGAALFPQTTIRLVLRDGGSGDVISLATYTFDEAPQPIPSLSLARNDPSHLRIASYNVENDGLFDGGSREAAQNRIADAVDPDVWVICEAWNSSASAVANQMETLLPSGPGEAWHAVKRDAGNVIVSRFPILDSWEINPGDRLSAALVDPGPSYVTDLLVVANHWSCCTADANRQRQADALIAFLDDARTPGGVLDLPVNTPLVVCGDFNLVGWRDQLVTLLTGDIADNGTWGPDSPPDWDGSDLEDANPRHPDARFAYTWRNDGSSFSPGKLDWVVYSGSVMTLGAHFVVETRTMLPSTLAATGLLAGDTEIASDHAAIVADFRIDGQLAAPHTPDSPQLQLARFPNPFRSSTTIAFQVQEPGRVQLAVYDLRGRRVRLIEDGERPAGSYEVRWDGTNDAGSAVASGVYLLSLQAGQHRRTQRVVRLP